jgi:prepilin-type N-terminal cleavage/methylation domain-containing protein
MKKAFTIVELLLVVLIFSIVMAIIYPTFQTFNKASKIQEDAMMLNQNLEVSLNYIERAIQMAGFGTKYSVEFQSKSVNGYSNIFTAVDGGSSGDDQLTIVYANRIFGQVAKDLSGNTSYSGNVIYTTSSNSDLLDSNLKKYVFIERNPYNQFFELISDPQTISGKTALYLDSSISLEVYENDYVYSIRAVTISYDSTNQQITINNNTGGSNQPLASYIEALQFQYGIDENDDGVFDDTDSDGDPLDNTIPTGKEFYVKLVRVSILGRSPNPDATYKDPNSSYSIANKTINIDTDDSNGINSQYDTHYRRRQITIDIIPRNFLYETF